MRQLLLLLVAASAAANVKEDQTTTAAEDYTTTIASETTTSGSTACPLGWIDDGKLGCFFFAPEMEKRADTADISVLFFFGCANFLAVHAQIR